jgi:hypothetical protein
MGCSSRRPIAALALAGAIAAATPALALDIDLTPTLAANPRIEHEIGRLCRQVCLGNKRKSWLDKAVVHGDLGGSSVTVRLKLRSKQVSHGLIVYEDTATVRIDADLSLADCGIANVRATSNNDLYRGLLKALAPEIRDAVQRKGKFC